MLSLLSYIDNIDTTEGPTESTIQETTTTIPTIETTSEQTSTTTESASQGIKTTRTALIETTPRIISSTQTTSSASSSQNIVATIATEIVAIFMKVMTNKMSRCSPIKTILLTIKSISHQNKHPVINKTISFPPRQFC